MNIRLILASTLIGLSLVACNGGGSSPTPIGVTVTPTPTAVPSGTPSTAPTAAAPVTESVVPAVANGVLTPTLQAATLAGLGLTSAPTISVPNGVTLPATLPPVTYTNESPGSITTFSHAARKGVRRPAQVASLTVPGATGLIFTTFTAPSDIVVPINTSLTFTYPLATTPVVGTEYRLAFYNGNQDVPSWNPDLAPSDVGVVNGNTVTVTATSPDAGTLVSGKTYGVVLYSTTSASPTPAPSATPTAVPTESPSPLPTVMPTSGSVPVSSNHTDTSTLTLNGSSAEVTLPIGSASGSLAYSISPDVPNGVTPLDSSFGTNVTTVYGYAMITPDTTITFPSGAHATASLAATGIPDGAYSLAVSTDGTHWVPGLGPTQASGNNLTLTVSSTEDITLTSGTPYYLAIYQ